MSIPAMSTALSKARLRKLFESGEGSDFCIKCGTMEFRVHKAVIGPQSEFFDKLCNSAFKENQQGHANLEGIDPDVLARAIQYFYTQTYCHAIRYSGDKHICEKLKEDGYRLAARFHATNNIRKRLRSTDNPSDCEACSALHIDIDLYILADYLLAPKLKEEAFKSCKAILTGSHYKPCLGGELIYGLKAIDQAHIDLKIVILRQCIKLRTHVDKDALLSFTLKQEDELSWTLLNESQNELEKETERLKQVNRELDNTITAGHYAKMGAQMVIREYDAQLAAKDAYIAKMQQTLQGLRDFN